MFLLAAFTAGACSKKEEITLKELDPVTDAALIAGIEQSAEPGIPFPEGSRAFYDGKDKTRIVLPEGYYFAMRSTTDEFLEPADGDGEAGVTCTCTSGSGCSPVKAKGKYYCVLGESCNSCDKKTSRISGDAVQIVGVYNPSLGITLLTRNKNEADGLKAAFMSTANDLLGNAYPTLFRIKGVKEELQQLYNFIYGTAIPAFITENSAVLPPGYRYAAISIYGNLAAIPIPESMAERDFYLLDGDGGTACRCNDVPAAGGCKKNSLLGAVFCDAGNCKSCSLLD
jgi:hypothetical protein